MNPFCLLSRLCGALAALALSLAPAAGSNLSLRGGNIPGKSGSPSASSTQTTTAATTAASEAQQSATVAANAQAALTRSMQALQSMQKAQTAAHAAAVASGLNNLGADPIHPGQPLPNVSPMLGLGVGGLYPSDGLTTAPTAAIEVVQLSNGKTISLSHGGTVVLPDGTPSGDTVSIQGAGSVTGGSVSASSGSVTTSTGGTLSTTSGGTVTVGGSGAKIVIPAATSISSSAAGTVTLSGGSTMALPANTAVIIPAGSTLAFAGSGSATVSVIGPGTVTLNGAGTLALGSVGMAASSGTITSRSGTTSFSSGATSTVAAGSTINLSGSGTLDFASTSGDVIPVVLPSPAAAGANAAASFTTTGTLLATAGYDVPSSWANIGALSETTNAATGKITDTITQDKQQALLYWSSFNIGKNTTLSFDQSAGGADVGDWVAINEIKDVSLSPSQILGSIQAPGQVYVINQNGIIFGGSSQINTHTLVASSLALNPAYIANGLLNDEQNSDQFQFSALTQETAATAGVHGHGGTPASLSPLFSAPSSSPTAKIIAVPTGDVTVQEGAELTSPADANGDGGRIALIAPNVVNDGTISTPAGQTILAAGLQVGLAAHNGNDPTLRGLDVFIGQVTAGAGALPTSTFTFNGLPGEDDLGATGPGENELTLTGTGQVGTYTPAGGTATPLFAGTTAIPLGSSVTLTGGTQSFAANNAGTAANAVAGEIEAARADVTLAGSTVDQFGLIDSSTSVTLNGRIDLLADFGARAVLANGSLAFSPVNTGTVNLGAGSVTQILPELASSETTFGSQLALSSLVDIQGLTIEMMPGSLLYAPSAQVPSGSSPALSGIGSILTSGVTFNAGTFFQASASAASVFSNNTGNILLDSGSSIDVSGSEDVAASVADNIIAVQLRGPELADSPLQQNGALRGTTVYVDIRDTGVYDGTPWIGTPIGDVSGYVNDIGHTVGQLTTAGGTVSLNAGGSIAAQSNSSINVSGGWIDYASAQVQTTKVITGGQVIDISQATPNLVYQGIYTGFNQVSAKYGIRQSYANSLLSAPVTETGYLQGGSGGSVVFTAPAMTLNGALKGNTITGAYQQTPLSQVNAVYAGASFLPVTEQTEAIPTSSMLGLNFYQRSVGNSGTVYAASSPNITFQTDEELAQNLPAANEIVLSQDIVDAEGFGDLSINTAASGTITVAAGAVLDAGVGDGDFVFAAANINIEGSVATPGTGGGMSFTVLDTKPGNQDLSTPAADPTRGQFTLGAGASLSASGQVVDERTNVSQTEAIGGGTISIRGLNVDLAPGSAIDVSGGVLLNAKGTATYGSAGSILVLGSADPGLSSLVDGGHLVLGATLTGYSGLVGGGGSLTVQAPLVQIGGAALLNGDGSTAALVAGEAGVTGNGTTLWLDRSDSAQEFFGEGGFSNFTVEGLGQIERDSSGNYRFDAAGDPLMSPAVLVAAGTVIHPVIESSVESAYSIGIAVTPLTAEQENTLLPSQRSALNLVLDAEGVTSSLNDQAPAEPGFPLLTGNGGLIVRGDLVIGAGARIVTDPQTNSAHGVSLLAANGTLAVLGSVIAPGGTITVQGGSTTSESSNGLLFAGTDPNQPFPTLDLGGSSLLSTAGAVEQSLDGLGYFTGTVLPGGTISLKGNIVAESGSVLDVSGASGVLAESAGALGSTPNSLQTLGPILTRVDSGGGAIVLNASQLLVDDATMLGSAGGSTATGGSLSVSSGFAVTASPGLVPPSPEDVSLIVSQEGLNNGYSLPAGAGSGLALLDGEALPAGAGDVGNAVNAAIGGEPVDSYFAANSNLFTTTHPQLSLSDNGGKAGGFASLTLAGTLDFAGPVRISTARSISVALSSGQGNSGSTGGVIYASAPVVLSAPYVALDSYETMYLPDQTTGYPDATGGAGSLTVDASVLADVGNLSLENIGTLTFNSAPGRVGDIRGSGTLQVAGSIVMNAAQIYPPTETTFTIEGDTVSFTSPAGQELPALPLSGGGTLNVDATTIVQNGVLRAPFGTINLGNSSTQQITLGTGSITSVSGVDPTTGQGITVPYGIVDVSGNWYDPQGNNITLAGPPAKAVHLLGSVVDLQSGSTVDLRGGGELFAYQFNPGTGGNQDILASPGPAFSSTSFAIVPTGSLAAYAPVGTYSSTATSLITNGAVDAGYFNSKLAVGEQIYLNGTPGLPAGTYTLLPARYALLPGAFLVQPTGGTLAETSIAQPDGSSVVSGYVTNGLDPTAPPLFSAFRVASQSVVLSQAPYMIENADTFFPAAAAAQNSSAPRLPFDSGQLVLNATQSLNVEGRLLSQPAAGGLGGEVDIASPESIYITGPNSADVPATGALVLDSAQLTGFGAADLLIGGYRTTTDEGTYVTVTTDNLIVDNAGATTDVDGVAVEGLAAPNLTLVSNDSLTLADGAEIEQLGSSGGGASSLQLSGNGVLLRLSSDPTAQVTRQGAVAGDSTSNLSIGAGVKIVTSAGKAVGSLVLDSTDALEINPSTTAPPVLLAQHLTLDSGIINLEVGSPATAPTSGLVITQPQLQSLLSSSQSLSLLSYSAIAFYGSGSIGASSVNASGQFTYQEANLALHARDLVYADSADSSGIAIDAQNVSLDNLAGGTALPVSSGAGTGSLTINAQTIQLGSGAVSIDGFSDVTLKAGSAILFDGLGSKPAGGDGTPTPSGLAVAGNLVLETPLITGAAAPEEKVSATTTSTLDEQIAATGALTLEAPATALAGPSTQSLASSLSLIGASITQGGGNSVTLHSGSLSLLATGPASDGSISLNGTLDLSGTAQTLYSLTNYTSGGQVVLDSQNGSVVLSPSAFINVAAGSGTGTGDSQPGQGGNLSITAAQSFRPGRIDGQGSTITLAGAGTVLAQGDGGTLNLDVGQLSASDNGEGTLSSVEEGLSGFAHQEVRDRNDATVTVDDMVTAESFSLAADGGSIVVNGKIDAADLTTGGTGGSIDLAANGSVTLNAGSLLTVAASQLNDAGQGGTITLAAGSYKGQDVGASSAAIDIESGAEVQLGVGGEDGGTLHLRAPQVAGGAYTAGSPYTPVAVNAANGGDPVDVAIAPIDTGSISHAGGIMVEGFYVQDAKAATAVVDNYESAAETNATAFTNHDTSIGHRIFGAAPASLSVEPGEEIDNSRGDLELQNTWDLSVLRYGASLLDGSGNVATNAAGNTILTDPGFLTVRTAGNFNLDFGASLNDGFDGSAGVSLSNVLLPVGSRSWSYGLTAGADFSAAQGSQVQTAQQLQQAGTAGSFQLGYQDSEAPYYLSDYTLDNANVFFQTVRTGTGDVRISAGGDVLLLNDLATIYTAGSQVDPTLDGTFVAPSGTSSTLQSLPATYSSNGGSVAIAAQGNIERESYAGTGNVLVADASSELPTNWLDREGSVSGGQVITPTTWWVDFTNFFEGIGALGGGNVSLKAAGSIVNVDAAVPTNARLVDGALTELGGGDLIIQAGTNIDGGVYYVERGNGQLTARDNIQTNDARNTASLGQPFTAIDDLPTTLFLGKGSYDVAAGGDLLLGPVANPFLLPQSFNNIASSQDLTSELSYFSTYAASDAVNVASTGGTVTLRDYADSGEGSLSAFYDNVQDASLTSPALGSQISAAEPWLRLAEASNPQHVISYFGAAGVFPVGSPGNSFGGVTALLPPTLRAAAYSGDLDLVGTFTLSPSATGTVDLLAAGSINAFVVNQVSTAGIVSIYSGSAYLNLSDADPAAIPGYSNPLSSGSMLGTLIPLFTDTGATEGLTLEQRQQLHADIDGQTLHAGDVDPVYVYAGSGDLSGLTLFSAKQAQIMAGRDLTDVAFYVQNNSGDDISVVSAGRDIVAYDAASALRQAAGSNLIGYSADGEPEGAGAGAPNAGDIQVSGPGTLEVLAGRNLTLGNDVGQNPNNTTPGDGLYTGLTSVGGALNPLLEREGGASIVAASGLGGPAAANGLGGALTFATFIADFLDPAGSSAGPYLAELASELNLTNPTETQAFAAFQALSGGQVQLNSQQQQIALDAFYLVLRDSGRNHNDPNSPGFGNYGAANRAISALFPSSDATTGDIDITSREIKTSNGGDIDLLAPHGQITVGIEQPSAQAVDQGILTVDGGDISIFAQGNVTVGTSRIFTLHGGNEVIFSTQGNIAAGASSKTVVSAPPTRVLVDPTSGDVITDLAGLATGGGIGVLASVQGAPPGNVDLIAPAGIVDAGDAGIRASGNLNIAAVQVLNASNISVGGKSAGVPTGPSVNIGALAAASSVAGSTQQAASNTTPNRPQENADQSATPSIIDVEVLGYGGGDQG